MKFESHDEKRHEAYFLTESSVRKGKIDGTGQSPCTVRVGITTNDHPPRIVLRTIDTNPEGRSPLVAMLDIESAKRIAKALLHAVQAVDKAQS